MNSISMFKDVSDKKLNKFENCSLAKQLDNSKMVDKSFNYDSSITRLKNNEVREERSPIQNKLDGLQRERSVAEDLKRTYPSSQGYSIISEAYLRGKDGRIQKDVITGEARRIDFIVLKNGRVVDPIEVTSKTADKTSQMAKEKRIRDAGGNYIKESNGKLTRIPSSVLTRIERRD